MMYRLSLNMILCWLAILTANGQIADEYQVKAAFLYNFAKFVEWPPQAFKNPQDPIAICILGQNPFGDALEQTVRGKMIDTRTFSIRQVTDARQASACHILFVSSSERKRARSVLGELKSSVLTVGEADGFTSDGGIVNFKIEEGRIQIQINVEAAEQEKLRISSKLLSLAQIVRK